MFTDSRHNRTDICRNAPTAKPERVLSMRRIILFVVLVSVLFNGFQLLACKLHLGFDSRQYILLGSSALEQMNLGHELFQWRPPGYPLLLAAVFGVFGRSSPTALLIIQHMMVVGTVLASVLIARHLWAHRGFVLLSGLFAALSLHVSGWANAVMPEAQYTLAISVSVLFIVRFANGGGWKSLAVASFVGAIAWITHPAGQCLIVVCVVCAIWRGWVVSRQTVKAGRRRLFLGRSGAFCLAAVVPAAIVIGSVVVNSWVQFGYVQITCGRGITLYFTAARVDRLDNPESVALNSLKDALVVAKEKNLITSPYSYEYPSQVWRAYQRVHDVTITDTFRVMEQAALDMLGGHELAIASRTVKDCYRTVVCPDFMYRFQPKGEGPARGHFVDPAKVVLLSLDTFLPNVKATVGEEVMANYMPVDTSPTFASESWSKIVGWYRQEFEQGDSVLGVGDTPYEESMLLALVGGVICLFRSNRMVWLVPGLAIVGQVVLVSFLVGTAPRYSVPILPLAFQFKALTVVMIWQLVRAIVFGRRNRLSESNQGRSLKNWNAEAAACSTDA